MISSPTFLPLLCHPATASPLALQVSVSLGWLPQGLVLHYRLTGQVSGIKLPPAAPPGPADGLWQHSCFEAFVSPVLAEHYREFNFSPSGQWAAYAFSAERQRDPAAETRQPVCPDIRLQYGPQQLDLWARLPDSALPSGRRLCVGLSAVIETHGGHLSYWALLHPRPDRPDFHHRGGWRDMQRHTEHPTASPSLPT